MVTPNLEPDSAVSGPASDEVLESASNADVLPPLPPVGNGQNVHSQQHVPTMPIVLPMQPPPMYYNAQAMQQHVNQLQHNPQAMQQHAQLMHMQMQMNQQIAQMQIMQQQMSMAPVPVQMMPRQEATSMQTGMPSGPLPGMTETSTQDATGGTQQSSDGVQGGALEDPPQEFVGMPIPQSFPIGMPMSGRLPMMGPAQQSMDPLPPGMQPVPMGGQIAWVSIGTPFSVPADATRSASTQGTCMQS
eukprot:Platyproteum_vivax@DN3940_c0_g1_i2.p1